MDDETEINSMYLEVPNEEIIEDYLLDKILENHKFEYEYIQEKRFVFITFDDTSYCTLSTYKFFQFMNVCKNILGLYPATRKKRLEPRFDY